MERGSPGAFCKSFSISIGPGNQPIGVMGLKVHMFSKEFHSILRMTLPSDFCFLLIPQLKTVLSFSAFVVNLLFIAISCLLLLEEPSPSGLPYLGYPLDQIAVSVLHIGIPSFNCLIIGALLFFKGRFLERKIFVLGLVLNALWVLYFLAAIILARNFGASVLFPLLAPILSLGIIWSGCSKQGPEARSVIERIQG